MKGACEIDPNQPWYASRVEEVTGAIRYEAFGPKNSFVMFQGPNAKADCQIFMDTVKGASAHEPESNHKL